MDKRDIAADYERERARLRGEKAKVDKRTESKPMERADEAAPEEAVPPKPQRRSKSQRESDSSADAE
ncbi:MAG: hypothetical protein ACRDMV_13240 [Streptosporangiales bacterium]